MSSLVPSQTLPIDDALIGMSRAVIEQFHSLMGKSIPASVVKVEKNNTIVTVKLELKSGFTLPEIQCAVNGPEYIRMPIQKGDKGLVIPADYFMGSMTGLGSGVATLGRQANLTTMIWTPVGNTKFEDVKEEDKNKVVLYGPDGAVLQTPKGDSGKVDVTEKGVTIYATKGDKTGNYMEASQEGFKFYIDGTLKYIIDGGGMRMIGGPRPGGGNFGITVTETGTQIDNFNWLRHVHEGVQPGTGNSQKINEIISPP